MMASNRAFVVGDQTQSTYSCFTIENRESSSHHSLKDAYLKNIAEGVSPAPSKQFHVFPQITIY